MASMRVLAPFKVASSLESECDEDEQSSDGHASEIGDHEETFCCPKTEGSQHNVPIYVKTLRTLLLGLVMAFVSSGMVFFELGLINEKFALAQRILNAHPSNPTLGIVKAVAFICTVSALMVAVAAAMVTTCVPLAAGSGLPELKGYLNGNTIPHLFGNGRNVVRALGAVLSTGAGLPVDREGPLISLGGAVGIAVTRLAMGKHFKKWVELDAASGRQELLLMDEKKFAFVKRTGAILGSAAGLAVAYNAPIGGVLYMLEEVTINGWPEKLTITAGIVVSIAVLGARFITEHMLSQEAHSLVIFMYGTDITALVWNWIDIPLILLVAGIASMVSALLSCGLLQMWKLRHNALACCRWPRSRGSRIVEAAVFAFVCAAILMTLPALLGDCRDLPEEELLHGRVFIRYTCPEDQYNQLATLFMQGEEGAVKTLFARDTAMVVSSSSSSSSSGGGGSSSSSGSSSVSSFRRLGGGGSSGHGDHAAVIEEYDVGALIACLAVYIPLCIGTAGLDLPMGYFVPSMLIGALVGRIVRGFVGNVAGNAGIGTLLAHPGVYGLLGSAGALSGFTHMSLAIVVLLMEVTKDINLCVPLLLSVLFARQISKMLIRHPYDEQLILEKGVPYLEVQCPHHLDREHITAGSLCARVPRSAALQAKASVQRIEQVLEVCTASELQNFPVFDEQWTRCIGLVPRVRLEAAVCAARNERQLVVPLHAKSSTKSKEELTPIDSVNIESDDDLVEISPQFLPETLQKLDYVDVMLLADPAPHFVLADTPIVRVYPLFSLAGLPAVCVLTNNPAELGEKIGSSGFLGVLARRHLVHTEAAIADPFDMDAVEQE